ncbi:site-specific integrase [Carboxylicivirga sediminis]|uniref:Site-specific integrase n=1 Tax=Carboxylicivirga sediminis TaxID=2006564 RepID=A0A941IXU4_9BACT|nr:site-specific integrase [Carboxylicivirga sediminis]MBR8537211.1 site-specific integrase [Carboxylicivirga sediminis]
MRFYLCFALRKERIRKDGTCTVFARFTYNKRRLELSTSVIIRPDDWDEVKQLVKDNSKNADTLNNRLKKVDTALHDTYNRLVSSGKTFTVDDIKNEFLGKSDSKGVLEVFDYYLKTIENNIGHGYAYRTLKHYRVSRKKLAVFIQSQLRKKDIPITDVDYNFLNQFDIHLKTEYGVHQNTAWNYHKHLKRVMNLAISMEYIQKSPYNQFKTKLEQANRNFLTKDELHRLETKSLEIDRLSIVRDIFIFACYTGLAYSDISKLSPRHIQKRDDGNQWIIINRTKTKSQCSIPIYPNVLKILERYADYPEALLKGRVLPVASNQKLNSYLKELANICNINKNLTMHMARHTFATTVTLSNGVPIETVSKVLGHKSLKITQIYARVLENKISEDMMAIKGKLGM